MGFLSFREKSETRMYAERVGVGLTQINDELRKGRSAISDVRGLCYAVSRDMQKMYAASDKLSANDKLTLSLLYNGTPILYNDFLKEIEFFRKMLLINYSIQLF